MFNFTQPIPLSLYIHIPWCVRKCPYCDFNSHQLRQEVPESKYIDQLIKDLEQDLPKVWGRRLTSIFFGGGTPSLFSPLAIERILTEVRARLPFQADMEITLEANPGTIDDARFAGFHQAGVNRLSIGIQSFQDEKLKQLGRIHDLKAAINAAKAAHTAGFSTFNLDLMFGLPQQSKQDALADLQTAIELNPTHISWYQLTLEPNTLFYRQPPVLPQDEVIEEIYFAGRELLAAAGFIQYEVSAYAKPQHRCQHNINYWEFGDYLGIGAGAHGKLTDVSQQRVTRLWKHKHPKDYLQAMTTFIAGEKDIVANEMPFEFMLNALRLYQPITFELFEQRSGLSHSVLIDRLRLAEHKGLIKLEGHSIVTTEFGQRLLNDVIEMFI